MGIPFDFGALAQGVGETGSLIQQYLMDKYMRGQEQQTWQKRQNILDQFKRQAETRGEQRNIRAEERADTRWYERAEETAQKQKDLFDYQVKTEANLKMFDMNPDYQAIVQRASSPESTLEEQMQLIGIQQLKAKQLRLEPLDENDYEVIGRLPVTMQNQFYAQEQQHEDFRQKLALKEQHYETMEDYYKSMIPGREASRKYTETRTKKVEGEIGEDFKKRYDDLNTDLQQLRKEYKQLMNEEYYKRLRRIESDKELRKQYWDDVRETDLQNFRTLEEGITGRIKEIEQELKNMRLQKKSGSLNLKALPEDDVTPPIPPKVLTAVQAMYPHLSSEQELKNMRQRKKSGSLNLKPLPDDVHTIPPIPPKVLTQVQAMYPHLSYEQIQQMWAQSGGRLSARDLKVLGLTEEDLRE